MGARDTGRISKLEGKQDQDNEVKLFVTTRSIEAQFGEKDLFSVSGKVILRTLNLSSNWKRVFV